jgi:predicted nucleotidyltransferase
MTSIPDRAIESLAPQLGELAAAQPAIVLAYLYGSMATGQTTPFSDVDIALLVDEHLLPPDRQLRFRLVLADEIDRRCGLSKADVRVINHAPLILRGQVVTDGILLFSRDEVQRVEFETRTRKEYFDFLPMAEFHRRVFFDDIHERGLNGQRTKG